MAGLAQRTSEQRPAFGAHERAFLPAALEIIETPPPPLGRATAWTISIVVLAAIVWAAVGEIDIISIASGKIIAPSHTQIIQPLAAGTIKSIMVEPGQTVRAGETLITLDDSDARAELAKAKGDLDTAVLDDARLTALLEPAAPDPFLSLAGIGPALIAQARLRLESERLARTSKLSVLDQQTAEKQADLQTAIEAAAKDDQVIPLLQQISDIRKNAAALQNGDLLQPLEAAQQLIAAQSDRRLQDLHMTGAKASIAELAEQRRQTQAEFTVQAYVDLARARADAAAARAALAKAQYGLDRLTLRSPLDGTVTQVNVHTVGAVVTPAEQLASIVSASRPIEIEAVLPNEDVGFVRVGQEAEVKVDAYPFTRYGLLKGTVAAVAHDAEALARGSDAPSNAPQPAADRTETLESSERLVYRVTVTLGDNTLLIDGAPAELVPGMAVSAEIKTGRQTVLSYLLSPLAAFLHDGLRER